MKNQAEMSAELMSAQANSGPGARLRNAREARKLSLEQMAQRLRLSKNQVAAIENDDYSYVTPVFARGHVRLYAQLVGLSANEMVRAFDATVGEISPADIKVNKTVPELPKVQKINVRSINFSKRGVLYTILAGMLILAVILTVYSITHHSKVASVDQTNLQSQPIPESENQTSIQVGPYQAAPAEVAPVRPDSGASVSLPLPNQPAEANSINSTTLPTAKHSGGR